MMVYRMVWLLEKKMLHWILWFVIKNQYTSLNKQTGVEFTHRRHTHRIQWLVPGPINQCLSKQSSVDDFKLTLKLSLCTCSGASLSFPWDPSQPSCIPFEKMSLKMSYLTLYNTTKTKKPLFCNHSVMTDMTRCSTYQKWQEQIFIFLWPFLFKDHDLIDWKKQVSTLLEDSLVVQSVQLGPKDPKIEKKTLLYFSMLQNHWQCLLIDNCVVWGLCHRNALTYIGRQ